MPMMICLFGGVFFVIRAIQRAGESRVNYALILFYTASTLLYTNHWLYYSGHPSFVGEWIYRIVNLCVYPLFYVYLRALTRAKGYTECLLMLLPAALMAVIFPLSTLCGWAWGDYITLFARACFGVQVLWVWFRGVKLLRNAKQRMDNTYSDYRSHRLDPLRTLLNLFGLIAVISLILNIIGREFFSEGIFAAIPAVIMTVLIYTLGYIAATTTLPPDTIPDTAPADKPLDAAEDELLQQKIDQLLQQQQLFLNPHLTIQDIAAAVNSNRTYVSNSINRTRGMNFSQYIARYRIAYARQILSDPKYSSDHDAVADAIALSGFTSDQTFYRVFKETCGITPLQYRRAQLPHEQIQQV